MLPITIGTAEQFARAREVLRGAGYTAEAVAERAGAATIFEFKAIFEGRAKALDLTDGLDVLIRLFMDSLPVSREDAGRWFSAEALGALTDLGLLAPTLKRPEGHDPPAWGP